MSALGGAIGQRGRISFTVIKRSAWPSAPMLRQIIRDGFPRPGLQPGVALWRARNLPNLLRGLGRVLAARALTIPHHYGAVYLEIIRADGSRVALGLASLRVVTNTGATKIVDVMRAADTVAQGFKYHGWGTGTTAEAATDTTLVTELTTEYAVDNTRPTGSQANNGAQVYRTVATLAPDGAGVLAITEHGIFSQAATGGGSLLDRSVFAAVNLTRSQDSLQTTYDFTVNSGG